MSVNEKRGSLKSLMESVPKVIAPGSGKSSGLARPPAVMALSSSHQVGAAHGHCERLCDPFRKAARRTGRYCDGVRGSGSGSGSEAARTFCVQAPTGEKVVNWSEKVVNWTRSRSGPRFWELRFARGANIDDHCRLSKISGTSEKLVFIGPTPRYLLSIF